MKPQAPGRPVRRRSGRRLVCVGLVAATAAPGVVQGAEWSWRPEARYQIEYNDNRRLRFDEEQEAVGSILRIGADLRYRTERTEIVLTPALRFERWIGDEELDTDDQSLDLLAHRLGERWRFDLDSSFERDSTLSTDRLTVDDLFDADIGVDSARITARRRRETLRAAPSFTYAVTERVTATAAASAQQTEFPNPGNTGLIDHDFASGSASVAWQMTERQQLTASAFVSRFEADQIESETTTFGAGGGYRYQHSPTLAGTFSLSVRTSDLEAPLLGVSATERGLTANAELEKRYERGFWVLTASRDLSPTLSGFLVQRDEARIRWEHRLRAHLTGILDARYIEDESLGEVSATEDQERVRLAATLRMRLQREWWLIGSYRYLRKERDSQPDPAESNALWLAVRYGGQRRLVDW